MGALFVVAIGVGFGLAMYRHSPYMVIGGSGWVPLFIMATAALAAFISGRRFGQRQYQWQIQQREQTQGQLQSQQLHVHLATHDEKAPGGSRMRVPGAVRGLEDGSQVGNLALGGEVVEHLESVAHRVRAELQTDSKQSLSSSDQEPFTFADIPEIGDLAVNENRGH